MYIACPQHGDLRLSGPPSGQGASDGARTRNRRVPADLRADSLSTVPPTPPLASKPEITLWLLNAGGASPQQDDLRLCGPPSGQSAGSGTRAHDRTVPADLRADSLATVPPTPLEMGRISFARGAGEYEERVAVSVLSNSKLLTLCSKPLRNL
ncbi:hypothetical protein PoB_004059900 [Plakobranchus ocellatus]|uniref:Uncharacterized protein n=1 Tax=Plakobranchus ocellatus TaxID=259542 RepID=A0AAV4B5Z1_9GAST|nr:hypothetical protein PoB_004059900 [Plakobranchus ocellatus]